MPYVEEDRVWCSATKDNGEICHARPVKGSDPPLCSMHSRTPEQRRRFIQQGVNARIRNARVRIDQQERLEGIAFGVSTEHILRVCKDALDAQIEYTGEPDWGARLSACAILLHVFPKSLRTTPEEAKVILDELLTGTRHAALKERAIREHFKALRREWFEVQTRVDSLGNIYAVAVPDWALGPNETAESVKREVPDFEGWTTEPLKNEAGQSIGYVRVTKPDGTQVILEQDRPFEQRRDAA